MRHWTVGGALLEGTGGLLLVQNRRRNGTLDWSPPGGVIDEGETLIEGLAREVNEETGLVVERWRGPIYEIEAVAEGLGWRLRVEAHLAVEYTGDIVIDDPDGIVQHAEFVAPEACAVHLDDAHRWVKEPLSDWLTERWSETRTYRYRVDGTDSSGLDISRM